MKTATIREFRNHYTRVLRWVAGGEEVEITRHGTVVAKVVPPSTRTGKADWTRSAALNRPAWSKALSNRERDAILAESQGS